MNTKRSILFLISLVLLVSCNTATPDNLLTPPGNLLYKGQALRVTQTKSEIFVENIFKDHVAIRVSWDGKDPYGRGDGPDSFLNNWVAPHEYIHQTILGHTTVQIWAWGKSSALIDSCNLNIQH